MNKPNQPPLVTSRWTKADLNEQRIEVSWSDNPFDKEIRTLRVSEHSGRLWIEAVSATTHDGAGKLSYRTHSLSQDEAATITRHSDLTVAHFRCRLQPPPKPAAA